ncbi:DUF5694 domain-containing protein [Pontibacter silvestris]|uniref:DUF5694 domain-containing protein n=1 Tax=Pontibacter silvestris TaxID=2305183 RepID=A0ABW4WXD0_9BACT|nr:DUF5694 domain-containing protein [Pontibacter silvestris]MCC9137382.1 DUF5694 domain-containing protein [Pontibacter silvestris]
MTVAQKMTQKQIEQRVQEIFPDSLVKADVLLLGLFHFNYPGLDGYKTEESMQVEILSKERQQQVKELTKLLATYKPTKIVVEYPAASQGKLDALYADFKLDDLKTKRDETYQLGFRLAKQLQHEKVYAFDSKPFRYSLASEDSAWIAKQFEQGEPLVKAWYDRYNQFYAYDDTITKRMPLKDYLLLLNSDEALRISHGVYLVETRIGTETEPAGADAFITSWYNRNIRMFSNLQRLAGKGDRILVLVGAGHVPILKHLLKNAPDMKLRRLDEFVKY